MALPLVSKPGLTGAAALSIPKTWDAPWFRGFINNLLKGADVRNALGINGIVVTGNIASPYATISIGGTGASYPVTLNPPAGTYGLQINGATFAAMSFNASGATGFTSDFYIFQNTGAAGSGGSYIGTRNANSLHLQTNATDRLVIDGAGLVTINQPTGGTTALSVTGPAGGRAVSANVATTSGGVAYTATDGGSTSNVLLATQTANFSSTGATAPVLTANKPGALTSILGWFRVSLNGTAGWIPVWNN